MLFSSDFVGSNSCVVKGAGRQHHTDSPSFPGTIFNFYPDVEWLTDHNALDFDQIEVHIFVSSGRHVVKKRQSSTPCSVQHWHSLFYTSWNRHNQIKKNLQEEIHLWKKKKKQNKEEKWRLTRLKYKTRNLLAEVDEMYQLWFENKGTPCRPITIKANNHISLLGWIVISLRLHHNDEYKSDFMLCFKKKKSKK